MRRLALCAAIALTCAHAESLRERIEAVLEKNPDAQQAFWGIHVVDAGSGAVLYNRNEEHGFVPASNTKLFTTSLALQRLGPDYRFHTTVEADREPDATGVVRELRLVGGGDPNLSGRAVPYSKEDPGSNPLACIEALAEKVIARGVREVTGDIVGDDTAYDWDPFPDGWAVDDPKWEYGAPVSALTFNDSSFKLTAAPGARAGDPVRIALVPPLEYLTIHNRAMTVASEPATLRFDRLPGWRELTITGTLAMKAAPRTTMLAIDDPALFAAYAFRETLLARGVKVGGAVRAAHRLADEAAVRTAGIEVARHASAPLSQIIQIINKASQNLHTEMLLLEIARAKYGRGSRAQGLKEISSYLQSIGVLEEQYRFEDASGLSRLTLVRPLTITTMLRAMYVSAVRETWLASFPAGGVDGTLETRFAFMPEAANIRAKTGSLTHVRALSGYAFRKDGGCYVFAILANNQNTSVTKTIDEIALALLE